MENLNNKGEEFAQEAEYDRLLISNLMQNSQDLIYFKDLESRFTKVSDSMVQRLGAASMEDVIGKSDFDFWDLESATKFFDAEQEIIRTHQPLTGKTESAVRPNGEVRWSLTSKMPLFDESGNVVGTFGVNKDITIQKEFEQEIELKNEKLVTASRRAGMAQVAASVLHNVGNVLNSINIAVMRADEINRGLSINNLDRTAALINDNAAAENFLAEDERGKRIPQYLTQIAASLQKDQQEIGSELAGAKRCLEHVKAIVAAQQRYAVGAKMVEEFDLAEVLEDAIRMSSRSLMRHRVTLTRDFDTGIMISTDKHRVLQTLINLIRNAKQAMKQVDRTDKELKISTRLESGTVSVSIQDNGIGIEDGNLKNLFQHGFTTRDGGHGFGLHSGANFAKELGGSLVASSEGHGKGATFTLTLPIVSTVADAEGAEFSIA